MSVDALSARKANGAISAPVLTPVTAANSGLASGSPVGTRRSHPLRKPGAKCTPVSATGNDEHINDRRCRPAPCLVFVVLALGTVDKLRDNALGRYVSPRVRRGTDREQLSLRLGGPRLTTAGGNQGRHHQHDRESRVQSVPMRARRCIASPNHGTHPALWDLKPIGCAAPSPRMSKANDYYARYRSVRIGPNQDSACLRAGLMASPDLIVCSAELRHSPAPR